MFLLASFGLFRAPFRLLFDPSWAKMEPKWRQVGPRWSQNGAKLASKTDLGALLGDLCGSGMPRDALGRDLGPQRTDLGAQNPPKIDPKSTKNRTNIVFFFFDTFSSCILKRFWRILAPCWLQFQRFLGTQSGFKPHRPIF